LHPDVKASYAIIFILRLRPNLTLLFYAQPQSCAVCGGVVVKNLPKASTHCILM
jgi:hypothetical protein